MSKAKAGSHPRATPASKKQVEEDGGADTEMNADEDDTYSCCLPLLCTDCQSVTTVHWVSGPV